MPTESQQRVARNVMVDKEKDERLERMRTSSTGYTTTTKGRSDIYNEILALGLRMQELRTELGEKEFEQLWTLLEKINLKKLNLAKLL